jgi:hypothetical protein
VFAAGLTVTVPPAAGRLLVLPSDPVTTTVVALVAATVRVEPVPAEMVVGFAAIVTVGAGGAAVTVTVAVAVTLRPLAAAVAV